MPDGIGRERGRGNGRPGHRGADVPQREYVVEDQQQIAAGRQCERGHDGARRDGSHARKNVVPGVLPQHALDDAERCDEQRHTERRREAVTQPGVL